MSKLTLTQADTDNLQALDNKMNTVRDAVRGAIQHYYQGIYL